MASIVASPGSQRLRHEELMDEVSPHIWLGRFEAALDDQEQNLKRLGITHVVSLGCFYGWWSLRTEPKHLLIPIEDKPLVFITDYFNDVFRFMDDALENNHNVLVHCEQGRSRSGAMVIAYLMRKERRPYPDILNRVLQHRKRVMPNIGFQIQLRAFASHGFNTAIKYSEIINLESELTNALKNLHDQVMALDYQIQSTERVYITLRHDGSNKRRTDNNSEVGVTFPSTTLDTRNPDETYADGRPSPVRPQYPFEWWTSRERTDDPAYWERHVQVGLTTDDLSHFRKEWVLLVFLSHQFQLYQIDVHTEVLEVLFAIGDCYFEDLLGTFGEVFVPVTALIKAVQIELEDAAATDSGSRPEKKIQNGIGSRPAQRVV